MNEHIKAVIKWNAEDLPLFYVIFFLQTTVPPLACAFCPGTYMLSLWGSDRQEHQGQALFSGEAAHFLIL